MPEPLTHTTYAPHEAAAPPGDAAGDRPEIVFVPGLNNSSSVWTPVIANLPWGFHARAVDCPALDTLDDVAAALLRDLPDRFVVVGHSFGGYVALTMLAQQPERLAGVILVGSGDNADTPQQAAGRLAKAEEARTGDYERMAMAGVDLVYHPNNVGNETLLADRLAGVREYGAQRYVAHLTACSRRPDRRQLLAETEVPLLVVASDQDRVIPPSNQRAMAERAGAAFRTVANAGHMLPAEEPAALARNIANWMASL